MLLNLIKDGIHFSWIVQHPYNAPKLCQPPMSGNLQRPGSLSGSLDLNEAHPTLGEDDQPIRRSRPICRCELHTKTTAICGGLAKLQFYFAFSDQNYLLFSLTS